MAARIASSSRRRALGLSLVEILVGVAIGLIGIVAIFQAVAVWSKHTSTTSAGGDAQVAGTLALFNIERDLKQAGHGFAKAATTVLGCDVAFDGQRPGARLQLRLAPGRHRGQRQRRARHHHDPVRRFVVLRRRGQLHRCDRDDQEAAPPRQLQARRPRGRRRQRGCVGGDGELPAGRDHQDDNPDGYTVGHTTDPYDSFYPGRRRRRSRRASTAPLGPVLHVGNDVQPRPAAALDIWRIQGNRVADAKRT